MSVAELERHRRVWRRKPLLADVYGVWFDALLRSLPVGASVLEVGAGPGFLEVHAGRRRPDLRWTSSDVIEVPWNRLVADALRLPLRASSFDAIVVVDLLHHLARPAAFFSEAARILKAGGRLGALEPWVTPFSYPVYRWTHPEGCRLDLDPWNPFDVAASADKEALRGDNACPWLLVRRTPASRWRELGFEAPASTLFNGVAYLSSLGFREASLLPRIVGRGLLPIDRALSPLSRWLALRALLVWQRLDDADAKHSQRTPESVRPSRNVG